MVWPSARISTEPWLERNLDGTLLGKFYLIGGGYIYNLWYNRTPQQILKVLKSLDYYKELKGDVLEKLSLADYSTLRRIVYLWRGIESAILCANIELIGKPIGPLHKQLWRWVISSAVHSYDNTVKLWKKVSLYFIHFGGNTPSRLENPFPRGVPGGHKNQHGYLWVQMMPWLNTFTVANLLGDNEVSKRDLERLGHLVQTRQLPPPPLTDKRFEVEYESWASDLTRDPVYTAEHQALTGKALNYFFDFQDKFMDSVSVRPHISLSGGGCYQNARAHGGRSIAFMRSFLRRYMLSPADADMTSQTWWGAPYVTIRGQPLLYTMCRKVPLNADIAFMCSAFRDELGTDTLLQAAMAEENSELKVEEPLFGLDRVLPLQLFQLSIELCVDHGYLPGPAHKWAVSDLQREFHRRPIPCKSIFICEAGNKVRPLTEAPGEVTIALQPLAHWLAGIIRGYPSLKSAFTRTYKGWDFSVDQMRSGKYFRGMGYSVFDLSAATNNINVKLCRYILQALVAKYAKSDDDRFLLLQLGELLFAPRLVEVRKDSRDAAYRVIKTTNGLMMGDPGAKEFLCLHSAIIHLACFAGSEIPIPRNLIAGDDIIGLNWLWQHNKLLDMHVFFGDKINKSKAAWSSRLAWYCEELLVLIPKSIGIGKAPWQVSYETEDLHVDLVKLRLLSPFASVSLMADEQFRNPAIGKGGALVKVLNWYPRQEIKDFCLRTFTKWMSEFIAKDPMVFLPRCVGGQGLPYLGDREELYERVLDQCGRSIVGIYMSLRYKLSYHGVIDFLIRRMATGNSVRGLIDPMTYELSSQYANLAFNQFRSKCKTFEEFRIELQATKSYEVSNKDVQRFINSKNYLSYHAIAENLDRLTAIRIGFSVAGNIVPLDEILPAKGHLPSPSEVLNTFLDKEVNVHSHMGGFNVQDLKADNNDLESFYQWVVSENCKEFISPQRLLWVPKEAIVDSLNGMTVDLPYNPSIETDSNPIKGSLNDTWVDPTIEGWESKVVSLRRL
jgi:hypothetical protein